LVSVGLVSDEELNEHLSPYFNATVTISNNQMQQIVGGKI